MYLGEGKVYQEKLDEFIKVAKDLEVNEISEGIEMPNEDEMIEENYIEQTLNEENGILVESEMRLPRRKKNTVDEENVAKDRNETIKKENGIKKKDRKLKFPCNQCDFKAVVHC